jgi:transposase
MSEASTIGLDLAKNVFQVHGIDREGRVVVARRLRRSEVLPYFAKLAPCLVGMEACATSHYWAREIAALGHAVRLMPAAYVKAYVKRSKTDAADAAAICEAVTRPTMRFVAAKSAEQQSALMLHRTRDLLVRQRTVLVNALRGHLAEFGIVAGPGLGKVPDLVGAVRGASPARLPELAREAAAAIVQQLEALHAQIEALERTIVSRHRACPTSRRLASIPGIGPIIASALAATVTAPQAFKSGRDLAAWIGLVPRQCSSGGKERSGGISKQGDRYLRRLLIVGASAVLRPLKQKARPEAPWLKALLERRPYKVVVVALANKMARIAWALLTRGGIYRGTRIMAAAAA